MGSIIVEDKKNYELTVINEYITLEADGHRLATFPDLIMTFDLENTKPLISAEVKDKPFVPPRSILGMAIKEFL